MFTFIQVTRYIYLVLWSILNVALKEWKIYLYIWYNICYFQLKFLCISDLFIRCWDLGARSMEWKGYTIDAARPTIWLYMLCRRYSDWIRNICLMYKYHVYNNLFWIFLIQMEYCLQSMYNCMVGRAASFLSPFYSILLGWELITKKLN